MIDEPKRSPRKWVFFPNGLEATNADEFKRRLREVAENHPSGPNSSGDEPKRPLLLVPGPGRELAAEDAARMAQALVEGLPSDAFEKFAEKSDDKADDEDAKD